VVNRCSDHSQTAWRRRHPTYYKCKQRAKRERVRKHKRLYTHNATGYCWNNVQIIHKLHDGVGTLVTLVVINVNNVWWMKNIDEKHKREHAFWPGCAAGVADKCDASVHVHNDKHFREHTITRKERKKTHKFGVLPGLTAQRALQMGLMLGCLQAQAYQSHNQDCHSLL
jgi:hypothetical protein